MIHFILIIFAAITTIPILATWIVYKATLKMTKNPRLAVHRAANWTSPLYIIAVAFLLAMIFDIQPAGPLILILLAAFMLIIIRQWRKEHEIAFGKAVKFFLRLSFLVFFCLYVVLVAAGIAGRILL